MSTILSSTWTLRLIMAGAVVGLGLDVALASPDERWLLVGSAVAGAVAGATVSTVGVFGGVLVPLLLLQGFEPRVAATMSLLLQVAVIPLGAHSHYVMGNIRSAIVRPLMFAGMAGAAMGALLSGILSDEIAGRAVALAIVVTGVFVLIDARRSPPTVPARAVRSSVIAAIGGIAGLASGISGAGWGPIGVKLMILARVTPREAIGSSLAARSVMAVTALVTYAVSSPIFELRLQPTVLVALAAGCLIGIVPASMLTGRLEDRRAARGIALVSIALVLPTLFGDLG